MTLSFPNSDVMTMLRIATVTFRLDSSQEYSRTPLKTVGKDLAPSRWYARLTSANFDHNELNEMQALVEALDGLINSFYVWNPIRRFPKLDPKGLVIGSNTVKINSLGSNSKSLSLKGLPAGYVLSRGDMLAFDYGSPAKRALHRVVEVTATANGSGVTPEFEVRPHIRTGAAVNADTFLKLPAAEMCMVPGSFDPQAALVVGTVSFEAFQVP